MCIFFYSERSVIDRHTTDLVDTIGSDLVYFSSQFVENAFITSQASSDVLSSHGTGHREKANCLLNKVVANSKNKENWLTTFIAIFSSQAAYKELADRMMESYQQGI